MKSRSSCLAFLALLLLTNLPTPASCAEEGFQPIFDGKTLDGWKAPDMTCWSVQDGAITATGTPDHPVTANQFLVWQFGELDDFELKLQFRIQGGPEANSGIQFRSRIPQDGHAIGYQADIDRKGDYVGALYDEQGRGMLAPRGEKITLAADGKRLSESIGDPQELFKAFKPDDWNEYHILAQGPHITLNINGRTTAELMDNQTGERDLAGALALQIHAGPPLTIQFKDIRLKRLPLENRKKIVFVAGPKSHDYMSHEHLAGFKLLAGDLKKSVPEIETAVYANGWPQDPTAFDNANAVVFNSDGGEGNILNAEKIPQVDALAQRGIGIGIFHYALIPPNNGFGKQWQHWIGGFYELNWSTNPFWTAEIQSLPQHPVANGVRPFTILDEWYFNMRFVPKGTGVTPILTAAPPDSTRQGPDGPHSGNPEVRANKGKAETLAWIYERPGGGRGFGFTGLHAHYNLAQDDYRKTLLNALVWAAGAQVPPQGVQSETPTLEEIEAHLDKPQPPNWDREKIRNLMAGWKDRK